MGFVHIFSKLSTAGNQKLLASVDTNERTCSAILRDLDKNSLFAFWFSS